MNLCNPWLKIAPAFYLHRFSINHLLRRKPNLILENRKVQFPHPKTYILKTPLPTMQYLIVTLIKGKAKTYQQKLLYKIPKLFKAKRAILRKPPAHITLKYFFETKNIKPVEKSIKEFCRSHKKSKYKIKGFNHFKKDVIFMDIIPSKQMTKTHQDFLKYFTKNTKIKLTSIDKTTHYHSSIAHNDIGNEFEGIQSYISKLSPKFDCEFDNITIIKVENNLLKIHKTYILK